MRSSGLEMIKEKQQAQLVVPPEDRTFFRYNCVNHPTGELSELTFKMAIPSQDTIMRRCTLVLPLTIHLKTRHDEDVHAVCAVRPDGLDQMFSSISVQLNGQRFDSTPDQKIHHRWCSPSLSYYSKDSGVMLPVSAAEDVASADPNPSFQERAREFTLDKSTDVDGGLCYKTELHVDLDCGPLGGFIRGALANVNVEVPYAYQMIVDVRFNTSDFSIDTQDSVAYQKNPWLGRALQIQQPISKLGVERRGLDISHDQLDIRRPLDAKIGEAEGAMMIAEFEPDRIGFFKTTPVDSIGYEHGNVLRAAQGQIIEGVISQQEARKLLPFLDAQDRRALFETSTETQAHPAKAPRAVIFGVEEGVFIANGGNPQNANTGVEDLQDNQDNTVLPSVTQSHARDDAIDSIFKEDGDYKPERVERTFDGDGDADNVSSVEEGPRFEGSRLYFALRRRDYKSATFGRKENASILAPLTRINHIFPNEDGADGGHSLDDQNAADVLMVPIYRISLAQSGKFFRIIMRTTAVDPSIVPNAAHPFGLIPIDIDRADMKVLGAGQSDYDVELQTLLDEYQGIICSEPMFEAPYHGDVDIYRVSNSDNVFEPEAEREDIIFKNDQGSEGFRLPYTTPGPVIEARGLALNQLQCIRNRPSFNAVYNDYETQESGGTHPFNTGEAFRGVGMTYGEENDDFDNDVNHSSRDLLQTLVSGTVKYEFEHADLGPICPIGARRERPFRRFSIRMSDDNKKILAGREFGMLTTKPHVLSLCTNNVLAATHGVDQAGEFKFPGDRGSIIDPESQNGFKPADSNDITQLAGVTRETISYTGFYTPMGENSIGVSCSYDDIGLKPAVQTPFFSTLEVDDDPETQQHFAGGTVIVYPDCNPQNSIVAARARVTDGKTPHFLVECIKGKSGLRDSYVLDDQRVEVFEFRDKLTLGDICEGNVKTCILRDMHIQEGFSSLFVYAYLDPDHVPHELAFSGLADMLMDVTQVRLQFNERVVFDFRNEDRKKFLYKTFMRCCPTSTLSYVQWCTMRPTLAFLPEEFCYNSLQEARFQIGTVNLDINLKTTRQWDKVIRELGSAECYMTNNIQRLQSKDLVNYRSRAEQLAVLKAIPVKLRMVAEYNRHTIEISRDGETVKQLNRKPAIDGPSGFERKEMKPQQGSIQTLRTKGFALPRI